MKSIRTFLSCRFPLKEFSQFFQRLLVHEKTINLANSFFTEVSAPSGDFAKIAKERKINLFELWPSKKDAVHIFERNKKKNREELKSHTKMIELSKVHKEELQYVLHQELSTEDVSLIDKWFPEIVRPIKVSQFISKIIDYYSSWLVLLLFSRSHNDACFETGVMNKDTF